MMVIYLPEKCEVEFDKLHEGDMFLILINIHA